MTGLLKDLMNDRAEHAGTPHLDLDAIVADGGKRVRRRRMVTGAGVAAVAAAVVAAVAVVPGIVDDADTDPVQPPVVQEFSTDQLTYADGTVINYGGRTIDVAPLRVRSLVVTTHGIVFVSEDRQVYFTDGGAPEQLNGTAQPGGGDVPTLVASGPYAAWIDRAGSQPELVVYNTAEQRETVRTADGTSGADDARDKTAVQAMDGSQLYWHNADGVVVTDVSASDPAPITLLPNASTEWLYGVVDGVFVRSSFDDQAVTVSRVVDAPEPNFAGSFGILSPDAGTVVTTDNLVLQVFDVQSQASVSPGKGFQFARFMQWLDDRTYVVLEDPPAGDGKADLRECRVPDRTCRTLAGSAAPLDALVTSNGFWQNGR